MKFLTFTALETLNQIKCGTLPAKISRTLVRDGMLEQVNGVWAVTAAGLEMIKATEARNYERQEAGRRAEDARALRAANKMNKEMWG